MRLSLTSRLVLVVLLALLGVGAASVAVLRARSESDAAREASASAQAASIAEELAVKRDALTRENRELLADGQPAPSLSSFAAALLAPLTDASAGYCQPDGKLIVRETVAPQHEMSPPLPGQRFPPGFERFREHGPDRSRWLLPLDREVVEAACRAPETADAPRKLRFLAPNDILLIAVAGGHKPFAAWALVRVPKRVRASEGLASPQLIALIALTMLALVVLCVDTVLRLRSGIGSLADALVSVQRDLHAPIPSPRTSELARIADGLRAMTAHLSNARERELALERRLGHEQRLASLGRVAAGVAHEIRNPLASIKLRLDAMARRKLDERSTRDVTRSLSEIARLDAVVGSLLLVARKDPAPLAAADVGALVDERLAALESFAAKKQVTLARRGELQASIDGAGMTRVIDNLVRNAIEASPEGSPVSVELERVAQTAILRVIDHGPGVDPARQSELFEPFFTSKPDGTGLGLSLSRAAVEAHGGNLSYAREGASTVFQVQLPGKAIA